jgi:CRISPR-associated exonuclease Cas4
MTISSETDYLQLSGIQHFAFCRRQWALIHVEQLWEENLRTVEGNLLHERTHDARFAEKRGSVIVARGMPVFSHVLGVSGICDVVEFHRDDASGVSLHGRSGKWHPCPVEYKRGKPKTIDADRLQLCAQAICLEEMLACNAIATGFLYYGEIRHREEVALTEALRVSVAEMFQEMRRYYERRLTPQVKSGKFCNACSLKGLCLPKLLGDNKSVTAYIQDSLCV